MEAVPFGSDGGDSLSLAWLYPQITTCEITGRSLLLINKVLARIRLQEVLKILAKLQAPSPVLRDYCFCCNVDMFQTYEICMPVCREGEEQKLLLLGHTDGKIYCIGSWVGGSLSIRQRVRFVWGGLACWWRTCVAILSGFGMASTSFLFFVEWHGTDKHETVSLILLFLICLGTFIKTSSSAHHMDVPDD